MPRGMFDPSKLSFERMPGEPPKAFSAFRMYRDMGSTRTLENVRISLGKPPVYAAMLEQWSTKYEWVERAGLYDAYLDAKEREAREAEFKRSGAFWEQQRQQALLENLKMSRKMRDAVNEMLDHPRTKQVVKSFGGKDVTIIQPANWNMSSLASLAKTLAELEAATIGEALQGAADDDFDPDNATIEELKEYIAKLKSRKAAT